QRLQDSGKRLAQDVAAQRVAGETLSQRTSQIRQQKAAAQAALATAGQTCQTIEALLRQVTQEHLQAQAAAEAMQADIGRAEEHLAQSDGQREHLAEQVTAAKVELARCQQRLESLRLRLVQFEDDQR